MIGTPKFSERLWEWRSFSKTLHKSLLNVMHELPMKFDRPTKMTDNYVWTPDCSLNIKLRDQDLKIKELIGFQPCYRDNTLGITTYAEQWTTEAYCFPISALLMKRIVKGLGLRNMSRTLRLVEDKEQFIESLQSQSNLVRILSIFKQREQRLLPIENDPKEKVDRRLEESVTVEISHLASPEDVCTLSLEHASIDKVIAAIPKIMRDVDKQIYTGMIFMNYLQAIKTWGLGKKVFD
ncbi:MAG: hypothetical protein ACRD8Z_03145 [Nitrososphaeraceae archaeon]